MKKFFISLLKVLGYFGIYLGAQFLVTFVYMIFTMIPVVVKYALGNYNLADPVVFNRYMVEIMQPLLDATMLLTIFSGLLTIGVIWLIFKCRKKKFTEELCLRRISGGTALSAAMMGFGFNLVLGILFIFLPEAWLESYEESAGIAFAGDLWLVVITVGIMAPLVEEILFRGLIYTRLKQGMPMVLAAVITSLWFGVMHGHPLWAAYASFLGFIMIWIFERTKSLLASMLFHFGYNLVAVISMALPVSTPDWVGVAVTGVGAAFAAMGLYWFLKIPKAGNVEGVTEAITAREGEETGGITEESAGESTDDSTENL